MSGAGLAADSTGNVFFLDANGSFDTTLNSHGFPIHGDYGNGFIKVGTSGPLAVADYFNMYNTVAESDADEDLGSGGALLLPDLKDSTGLIRHLAVGAVQRQKHIRGESRQHGQVQFDEKQYLGGNWSGSAGWGMGNARLLQQHRVLRRGRRPHQGICRFSGAAFNLPGQ